MQERKNPSNARLATSAKREVPRAGFFRVFYKRKTRQAFFNSRLHQPNPSSGRSRYIRAPLTTVFLLRKNTRLFCEDATRRPCRALKEFSARLATSAKREVPRAGIMRVSYERKTPQAFFAFRLHQAISSNAQDYARLLSHGATQALHRVSS
ncbi:hypothetical protein [Treponema sp. Marseille-Q4132]|uniref:hypothetical protein n=1 Tax=Treponema sp. Marseille-Q4132 TaxID=2766701 RepID=UPI001652B863|nr:hypothetical protein [Treponema sp. Marseille-Q4132]QNL97159.1 hypothetical protein H9I35_12235 [Treponema sp. Marseille-Q4132]